MKNFIKKFIYSTEKTTDEDGTTTIEFKIMLLIPSLIIVGLIWWLA